MASLNSALLIVGSILFAVITTAVSLKVVVWFVNLFAYGPDPSTHVPAPSFMRSVKINILVFGMMAAMFYTGEYGLKLIYAQDAFRYSGSLQSFETLLGMILMAVVLIKMLPTSIGRGFLIAFIDWVVLFLTLAGLMGMAIVLAYWDYKPGK